MTSTQTLTRTDEDAEGAYTESMTITIEGDEVRQTFTTNGEVTGDSIAYSGPDAAGWVRDRLIEYRADGWA